MTVVRVNPEKCTQCKECLRVCPAHQLLTLRLGKVLWSGVKEAGLAWHIEGQVRHQSSSGGAARTILAGCLSEGRCDAVYTLTKRDSRPWAAGELIRGQLDINRVASSMYLPILALEHLRFAGTIKTLAIVGTTCQLLAATRLLKGRVDKLIRIAILCKQQKHLGFTRFVGTRLGVGAEASFFQVEYRGQGWPGRVKVNNNTLDWEQAAAIPFGKRLWCIPGCHFCPNPLGYKPDLTLADPWGLEPTQTAGKTMAIAWTDCGRDLLNSTPYLRFEPHLAVENIQRSIGWRNLQRKAALVSYYRGGNVPPLVSLSGRLVSIQTRILEKILERYRLPSLCYKIIARLPDPMRLIPVPTGEQ